jgi:hypothetical protein
MALPNNPRKGSEAEYLSQFYLSTFSFSNPTYRQEDFGIDFVCSLIDEEGINLYPTDSFCIQVKTTKDENKQLIQLKKENEKDLDWFYYNQIPYFLCWIDMEGDKTMYFYSVAQVWILEARKNRSYKFIKIIYETDVNGSCTNGFEPTKEGDTYTFNIGHPFMTISFEDAKRKEMMGVKKEILRSVINVERENISFRNLKLPLMRWLYKYETNNKDTFIFGWNHLCDKNKDESINIPGNILAHLGQLLITLAKSYELHKNDTENGDKYILHHNNLRKMIADLPFNDKDIEEILYEYNRYLPDLGFTDKYGNMLPDITKD